MSDADIEYIGSSAGMLGITYVLLPVRRMELIEQWCKLWFKPSQELPNPLAKWSNPWYQEHQCQVWDHGVGG